MRSRSVLAALAMAMLFSQCADPYGTKLRASRRFVGPTLAENGPDVVPWNLTFSGYEGGAFDGVLVLHMNPGELPATYLQDAKYDLRLRVECRAASTNGGKGRTLLLSERFGGQPVEEIVLDDPRTFGIGPPNIYLANLQPIGTDALLVTVHVDRADPVLLRAQPRLVIEQQSK